MNKFVNIHTHSSQITDNDEIIEVKSINIEDGIGIDALRLCSVAIHPWSVKNYFDNNSYIAFLENNAIKDNVIAIGETGLDRLYHETFSLQKDLLLKHIEISEKYCKPMILHVVRSFPEIISIRKQTKAKMPWIIHAFQSNVQTLEQLLPYDIYFSLSNVLFNNEKRAVELLSRIPKDRLFLETDDSNKSILSVYERAALLSGMTIDVLREDIFSNFVKIFGQI
ncbi:MAG: hypothetical protein E7066_01710 [Lentimicrobiaceae bacterium]|nr:hypothetical protein [Lentimicrobiaceae bacterium]